MPHCFSSGHCSSFSKPDFCDVYFKLCIGDKKSRECSILDMRTPKSLLMDQNSMSFGDFIDYIPNPLYRTVAKLPPKLYLKVEVWDADYSFSDLDDHLATFEDNEYKYDVYPFEINSRSKHGGLPLLSSHHHHRLFQNISQGYLTLYVAIWAVCDRDSYGNDCSVSCIPENRIRHYGCDILTGAKVCLPGWFGDECDKIDHCDFLTSCGPMGTCINTPVGYKCNCKYNFTGPHCSEPPNQCSPAQDNCQNGFCLLKYFDEENRNISTPVPYCACIPGFTGDWCDLDIDECTTKINDKNNVSGHPVTPYCNANSTCENLYGNFRCFCQNRWSGLRCDTPPTIWPDHYKPITSSKGLPDFTNFKRINSSTVAPPKGNQNDVTVVEKTTNIWVYVLLSIFIFMCLISCGIIYCIFRRRKRLGSTYKVGWNREPAISQVLFTTKPAISSFNKEASISYDQPLPISQASITKLTFVPRCTVPMQSEKYQSTIYDEIPESFLQEQTQLTTNISIRKSEISIYEPYSQLEYDTLDTTVDLKYSNNHEIVNTHDNVDNQLQQEHDLSPTNCMYLEPKHNFLLNMN
uniref:Delta-like protein D n=1 Tax=Schistosoma japonicum TaxID=6182 RepID=C1L4W7_SCHJA|nr:Delta-like protein D precursor [Schistosoma japonicum]